MLPLIPTSMIFQKCQPLHPAIWIRVGAFTSKCKGFHCTATEPLRGGSLLFTTKFPERILVLFLVQYEYYISPNGEMDVGYIWVWSTIQTNKRQKVRLSFCDCRNEGLFYKLHACDFLEKGQKKGKNAKKWQKKAKYSKIWKIFWN